MAELKDQLKADMKTAMKAKDKDTLRAIRAALAAIGVKEVEGEAHDLTTEEEQAVVTKEVRQRKDSAQAYTEGGRPELAEAELAEADVLARYLPAPLTEAELTALVDAEIAKLEEPSLKQMGKVMGAVNQQAKGRADGAAVAALVKQKLGQAS
ncbi:GatB/YqeY domain-containing protein [Granulicoccus phenolivorans]|uniref:GatB/YqeY domain-containing protein n=1 Tax=Granulicoccus phenolivorans TaxID=266854 RepID=UPI00047E5736|nr:GatB/YqeY domain-containing protein [Granulicoccus phenolivorans]